jgi:hypothetical protein
MTRRAVTVVVAVMMLTAGCSLLPSGATSFEAGTATVSEDAQSETGYELERSDTQEISRSFAGQNVTVTNNLTEYGRSADLPAFGDTRIARFTVLATPQVEVAGQGPFNPVAQFSNRDLVLRLQEQYDSIGNVRDSTNRTVTMLGEETRVTRFRADAQTAGGEDVEVFIHVTRVQHEGDFVIAVAVHPTRLEGEQANVDTLLEGVEHEGNEE